MKTKIKNLLKEEKFTKIGRGLLALLLIGLAAYGSLFALFPTRVIPANAPADQFSAERALAYLPAIASEPHPQGSPAQMRVRDYLVEQLGGYGLEVEVQKTKGLENVIARLHGSNPNGAILILAHYDTSSNSPGAADNGSGVVTLLEIMRALSTGPALQNDVIALFDDGEEAPHIFAGTKGFVARHPWMEDVRVAIGMDTAVGGFICTDDTGPENGWMVHVLSRAYTGGGWYSISGGGTYDSQPFRNAGIQVLELEDNYPFYQQHTPADLPAIVKPGTLQQLGEQALAVTRVMGDLDLSTTMGAIETYGSIPFAALIHYPESWSPYLAILAVVVFATAFVLGKIRKLISWLGLGVALLAILLSVVVSAIGVNALWKTAPDLFGWPTNQWSEWPEVIPPQGWGIFLLSNLVVLGLVAAAYILVRRWSSPADFSLLGLGIFLLISVACAIAVPRATILTVWPVLIGSVGWILAALLRRGKREWLTDLAALLAALTIILFILPLLPGVFMGDGAKSVAIISGFFPLLLSVTLPAIDSLLVRGRASSG
jgi:hypothetical protein